MTTPCGANQGASVMRARLLDRLSALPCPVLSTLDPTWELDSDPALHHVLDRLLGVAWLHTVSSCDGGPHGHGEIEIGMHVRIEALSSQFRGLLLNWATAVDRVCPDLTLEVVWGQLLPDIGPTEPGYVCLVARVSNGHEGWEAERRRILTRWENSLQ